MLKKQHFQHQIPYNEHDKKVIGRKNNDGSEWVPTDHSKICAIHFFSGKPSIDPKDQDYVPSWFPGKPNVEYTKVCTIGVLVILL